MKPFPTADELGDDGIFRHSSELQRDWYASEVVLLLREARPMVSSYWRKNERALNAAVARNDDFHTSKHRNAAAKAAELGTAIDAVLRELEGK